MATMERPRPSASSSAAPVVAAAAAPAAVAAAPEVAAAPSPEAAAAPAVASPAAPATESSSTTAAAGSSKTASPSTRRATALTSAERREANTQAELYAILVATEHLEQAFVRGIVSNDDYDRNCNQLLAQFKVLRDGVREKIPDIKAWAKENGLSCPLAETRLLGTGVTATTLYGSQDTAQSSARYACVEATERFITLQNALQLNMNAVDDLLPCVRDVQASIVNIPNLPRLAGLERIQGWLATLNGMRASDSLDKEQCRQLSLDTEQAYAALKMWLHEQP